MQWFRNSVNQKEYWLADYWLESTTDLREASFSLAIGQSVGNPTIRSRRETEKLLEQHSAIILADETKLKNLTKGRVRIAFPLKNMNIQEDGVTQLLVQAMGGQLDIKIIKKCRLLNLDLPKAFKFKGPRFGIKGVRQFTGVNDRPILGGIIKPKVGLSSQELLVVMKEMVEGGVNFIKEDEIMANPGCCPLEKRVPLVMQYLKGKKVIYAVCINSDYPYILERARRVYELGGNAVHVNWWAGLGIYKAIRELDLPLFLFFQKSGDRIITDEKHRFHIAWPVICQLAGLMGVDIIHAGMWGGYLAETAASLRKTLAVLAAYNVLPSLSCGLHPGMIGAINKRFGVNYLANAGGAIHGHPGGTKAGVQAFRQAIDGKLGREYFAAVRLWGEVKP
ncbi:MAG: Ribulose 1,5-bisphosphate carboxylase, large subunit [Candidatus Beckwithbacteria bacterium GW2011_GWA2_43_10]|uniref:Ribulose 1,5-bisphosphate carboxylase, large subunit n=1 Tax=Candidatus Beckwithbacteria bacterium GW2011_GWA2_43_10 TaxID=1618369 RepID=A0A0G1EY57_9BACT|nr:MAG: Ribulose 1,5-bisphosphate carboxylase, large subunit [Candidatus Beckwithbacteria bacterium GW2011_GWA2_43_10]